MATYADSSFIVCLYSPDVHSHEANRRMLQKPLVLLTPVNRAELAHSLQRQVFRERIDAATAAAAWDAFEEDCQRGLWVVNDLPDNAWERSIDLARRHGPALGVRTLDSLHVACAVELKARHFWTFDERQANLAKAAGLNTAG